MIVLAAVDRKTRRSQDERHPTSNLTQSGPEARFEEVELPGVVTVEIMILWGANVLHVTHLTPPRSFYVGEGDSKDLPVDFVIPEQLLGTKRWPLVLFSEGRLRVVIPPLAGGVAELPGQSQTSLDQVRAASPRVECRQGHEMLLPMGARARIEIDQLVLCVAAVHASKPPRAGIRGALDWRAAEFFALSALGHAACIAALTALTPSLGLPSEGGIDKDQLRLIQYYLANADEREQAAKEAEQVAQERALGREGGTGTRAKGEDGSMGSMATNRRYAAQGPRPNGAPAAGLREAQAFGMIGLISRGAAGDPNAPTAPWGRDTTLGTDETSARGSMWGDGAAVGFGSGRLGLSGIGQGGGGRGMGIGLGGNPRRAGVATQRTTGPGPLRGAPTWNTEAYDAIEENGFVSVATDPRSTFSIDVDTASYSLIRRHLNGGNLPPSGAVRLEEMINYFDYDYPQPTDSTPFAVATEVAAAPWNPRHKLVRIGIKGRHVQVEERPSVNLVFLIDVSGSMQYGDKLPLLKRGFAMLTQQLDADDRVSIVVYAGASGVVLPPTPGDQKGTILRAIANLEAGGSTNGGAGIHLAYEQARSAYLPGGQNRVVLATDGDFNVGTTNQSELVALIEHKRQQGVFLSVLGFGDGNYNDSTLEKLADKGNGNYAYIDSLPEAQKVLVEEAAGTLLTIAKDVKIQVEFNPTRVAGYRLIGYENRRLAHRDFTDDRKDAGDIGADHTVTGLYEIVPVGYDVPGGSVGSLRYQQPTRPTDEARTDELMTVKLRYKTPNGARSSEVAYAVRDTQRGFAAASADFRFAASVAEFGMLLRGSSHRGTASYQQVVEIARGSERGDQRRGELVALVKKARAIAADG